MRSHGSETPREPWQFGNPGEPYYESILSSIRLRYRLLPYIYSVAARVSKEGYTMTRALAFDFPKDEKVLNLKDEFMFGPSLLVAPMTESGNSRKVYLPKGSGWRDFYTNRHYEGSQWITVDAPISQIPLFVRDGSILPLGPDVEYADESPAPVEILVYPGADTSFTLYQDAGDGYAYEKGDFSTQVFTWDEKAQRLKQGKRVGRYNGAILPKEKITIIR